MRSERAPDADISTIGAWSLPAWTSRFLARPHVPTLVGPVLAEKASALHAEMGLKTSKVEALLSELASGDAALVRLAHQPNLFPYEQLIAQTVYLADAAVALVTAGRRVVPIILVVDFDESDDKRIKGARAFDPTVPDQIRHVKVIPGKSVPTYLVDPPDPAHRATMVSQLSAFAKAYGCKADHVIEHSGVTRTARSLADFNLFSWMQLTIGLWDLPLLFVRLSDIAPIFETERLALVDRIAEIAGGERAKYLWHICQRCSTRVSFGKTCCGASDYHGWSVPRVMIDDLCDYAIYGVSGGTAYQPAQDHLTLAHGIAARLAIDLPPESCWRLPPQAFQGRASYARGKHPLAKAMLDKGHNSLLEHILDHERAMRSLAEARHFVVTHLI